MALAEIAALIREPSCDQLDAWERRVEIDATRRRHALDLARRLLSIEAASFTSVDHAHAGKESMTTFTTVSRTEMGHVRENNEDAVATGDRLAVVADGMGGHPGGEVASAVGSRSLQAAFTGQSLDELRAAARGATARSGIAPAASSELEGMGTTICAAGPDRRRKARGRECRRQPRLRVARRVVSRN